MAVWPHPVGFLDVLFFLVLVWAFVELAVMPGEQGANRYGLNPMLLAQAWQPRRTSSRFREAKTGTHKRLILKV